VVARRLRKNIVSAAKSRSVVDKPPVLQYNTLDFAGQLEYRAMHHCFIVPRAIYLAVFNLQVLRGALGDGTLRGALGDGTEREKTQQEIEERERALDEVRYWLNSIHAHIHKTGSREPQHLKRVILVGTHRSPPDLPPITEEELGQIDKLLGEIYKGTPIFNDMFSAGDELWLAAVENSQDGADKRKESGAASVQQAIRKCWEELDYEKEAYPTTWLRFEAYLQRQRGSDVKVKIVDAESVRQAARERFGIGGEDERDIELALRFFHDTGTIVYPRKHPALYLTEEEREELGGLVLLDPGWLTRMMRNVMELKPGRGYKLTNTELEDLRATGQAKLSLLRKCWSELSNGDFRRLVLMLQSFCLVFPLHEAPSQPPAATSTLSPAAQPDPVPLGAGQDSQPVQPDPAPLGAGQDSQPAHPDPAPLGAGQDSQPVQPDPAPLGAGQDSQPAHPDPAPLGAGQDSQPAQPDPGPLGAGQDSQPVQPDPAPLGAGQDSQPESSSVSNTVYLIPSKLSFEKFDQCINNKFDLSFVFDFRGFLPEEVYHRLLCLMLKKSRNPKKGKFTAQHLKVYNVEKCNWVVEMVKSKLNVWVKYPKSNPCPPSTYVSLLHMDFLQKICNEEGSSLQGLSYIGGPVHLCEHDHSEVVPCVSFPEDGDLVHSWTCDDCKESYDVEKLLDPKYKPTDGCLVASPTLEDQSTTVNMTTLRWFPVCLSQRMETRCTVGRVMTVKSPTM
jgi:hypothetical protein